MPALPLLGRLITQAVLGAGWQPRWSFSRLPLDPFMGSVLPPHAAEPTMKPGATWFLCQPPSVRLFCVQPLQHGKPMPTAYTGAVAPTAPAPARHEEPAPVAPARLQGRMTPNGYEAENAAWLPYLTYPDKRLGTRADGSPRLAGRNPMELSLETLRKAGHPNRSTRALIRALGNPNGQHEDNEEGDPMRTLEAVSAYRDIPAYCNECAGDASARRRCATVNCPFWAYRMGRNPHNPQRGAKTGFALKKSHAGSQIDHEGEPAARAVPATHH